MPPKPLRTSDIAKAIGVHPNTVRLYEEWGFLQPIARSAAGYRLFTPAHLEQMRLAHLALHWPYPGGKEVVLDIVHSAAAGDLGMALERAYQYLANVRMERTYAEAAVEFLERWARGQVVDATPQRFSIGQAADRLGLSVDVLRNWERSGLLAPPRDPATGYRFYTSAELARLRVIRMLRQAGYSMLAILRMLTQFDAGRRENLAAALDLPAGHEDVLTVADRWLSTLAAQEERAQAVIRQLGRMMERAQMPG